MKIHQNSSQKFVDQGLCNPKDTTHDLTQKNMNFAQVEFGVLNKTQNPGLSKYNTYVELCCPTKWE